MYLYLFAFIWLFLHLLRYSRVVISRSVSLLVNSSFILIFRNFLLAFCYIWLLLMPLFFFLHTLTISAAHLTYLCLFKSVSFSFFSTSISIFCSHRIAFSFFSHLPLFHSLYICLFFILFGYPFFLLFIISVNFHSFHMWLFFILFTSVPFSPLFTLFRFVLFPLFTSVSFSFIWVTPFSFSLHLSVFSSLYMYQFSFFSHVTIIHSFHIYDLYISIRSIIFFSYMIINA